MYVKMMKQAINGVTHPNSYTLYSGVDSVEFKDPGEQDSYPSMELRYKLDGYEDEFAWKPLSGTVYVMTEDGKTIDKYEVDPQKAYRIT